MSALPSPSPSNASSNSSASINSAGTWATDRQCPGYDKDLIISELTSLYQLLTRIHISPADLFLPPEGGWPDLTPEFLAPLGKTPRVYELLRHLPYIRRDSYHDIRQVWTKTVCVDYQGGYVRDRLTSGHYDDYDIGPDNDLSILPPHVVTILNTGGERYGYYVLLDTQRGTVSMCDFMWENGYFMEYNDWSLKATESWDDGQSDWWKDFQAMTITDMCDMIKNEWTDMTLIALGNDDYLMSWELDEATRAKFKKIFETHNWLRKGYKQVECLESANKLAKEVGKA